MEIALERGVQIHRCLGCSGLWLDPGELESLVDDPGPVQPSVARIRDGMKTVRVPNHEVKYRKCPRCASVMDRRNYGSHSGVVVDECRRHGIYLDPGEFEAIETFIKLGGLSLEQVNNRRRIETARQRAEVAAAMASAGPTRVARSHHHSWGSLLGWFFD